MTGLSSAGESLLLTELMDGKFISMHTGDPGNTGASETAGASYARQSSTWGVTGGNPSTISNLAVIQYDAAGSDWGTLTHFGVWTAVSGGSFLGGWPLLVAKTVVAGDAVRWDVGKLQILTDDV